MEYVLNVLVELPGLENYGNRETKPVISGKYELKMCLRLYFFSKNNESRWSNILQVILTNNIDIFLDVMADHESI